jgi:hypothetical protein
MKKIIVTALATASVLTLGACAKSDDGANSAVVSDVSVNEGAIGADGNLGATDDFGNAAASDNTVLANDTLGNSGLDNDAAGTNQF